MMTRKTLHHHRRRERGREKKKANLHLLRAHGGLCITTLLKTCIKTSSSPNKYSYIYIFFTSFVSKAEPFLLCGTKLCIVQKYSGTAFVFPSRRRRASPFPLIHALSLVQHTCITVKNNNKKKNKTSSPVTRNHSMGTKNAHRHVHSRCLLHIKTHTEKGGFLLYPISTFTSSSQLQWQPKPSQPMFPTSMKATTQNDRKRKNNTFDSWPLLI